MNSPRTRALAAQRQAFKRFLVARLGNEADADDLLQEGLLKAWQQAGELRDEDRLTAWFYRILRNAIVDLARSRQASTRREQAWVEEERAGGDGRSDSERELCRCFEPLLEEMKPKRAALLRAVELEGRPVSIVARELGLTANHASVTLHRARAELRGRLEAVCGACADGGCLDCGCAPRV